MSLLPQFGFVELMVVAIVALIVIGPRELPGLMRNLGRMLGNARRMAGEFTSAFDEMARDVEMEELRQEMEALKRENPLSEAKAMMDDEASMVNEALDEEVSQVPPQHTFSKTAPPQSIPFEPTPSRDSTDQPDGEQSPDKVDE